MRARVNQFTKAARFVAGEQDTTWEPQPFDRSLYPVILVHGSNAPFQFIQDTRTNSLRTGFYLGWNGGRLSGSGVFHGQTWANDQVMTDLSATRTYLNTTYNLTGTRGKVHLVGFSMGGGAAMRYAALNPNNVASVTSILGMADLVGYYDGLPLGATKTEIATAWGVVSPAALPAGADLLTVCADMDVPSRLYYVTDDALVTVASVLALAAAAGPNSEAISLGTGGHTEVPVGTLFAQDGGGAMAVVNWMNENEN